MLSSACIAQSLRDPTSPLGKNASIEKESSLKLQAVFTQGRTKTAVINNRTMKLGESIEGWTLNRIEKNAVSIAKGERSRNLYVHATVSRSLRD